MGLPVNIFLSATSYLRKIKFRVVIGGFIFVGGLGLALFLANNKTFFQGRASIGESVACIAGAISSDSARLDTLDISSLKQELQKTTDELKVQAAQLFIAQAEDKKVAVKQISEKRNEIFSKIVSVSPADALQIATSNQSDSTLSALSKLSSNCVETRTQFKGQLKVQFVESDDVQSSSSQPMYSLKLDSGLELPIVFSTENKVSLTPDALVQIDGIVVANQILVDGGNLKSIQTVGSVNSSSLQANSSKGNKVLVVLANFSNNQMRAATKSTIDTIVFDKVNAFYKQNSYGKTYLSGQVMDWITLPITQTCDTKAILPAVIAKIDKEVDFKSFDALVISSPVANKNGRGCGWGGISTKGKKVVSTADGNVALGLTFMSLNYANAAYYQKNLTHELGHSIYGLIHAAYVTCPRVVSAQANCAKEYYDPFDSMGGGKAENVSGYFSAAHKDLLGWFSPSNILMVEESGIFELEPLETTTSGLKALKIPRTDGKFIYVEFRQPIGSDANFSPASFNLFRGVLLHSNYEIAYPTGGYSGTFLLNPLGSENVSSALTTGNVFEDTATRTRIRLITIKNAENPANAKAVVEVLENGRAIAKPTPTYTPTPTLTPTKKPTPTSTPRPTATPTKVPIPTLRYPSLSPTPNISTRGADLKVVRFVLTDEAGVEKTIFKINENIFAKVIFQNDGDEKAYSVTGKVISQFFSNMVTLVPFGLTSDINMFMVNGEYGVKSSKEYGSSNIGPNSWAFDGARSWTMKKSGVYNARVIINYDKKVPEINFSNNQAVVSYQIIN